MVFMYKTVKSIYIPSNGLSGARQTKSCYLPNPYGFSSMPLQSGIFTFNRNMIIGFLSSLITAALGYGIRLLLLKYLEYDVFTNLDNWITSLSYFCSLGGIRFVINECLKENTFIMSYCGGPMTVSNNTAGTGYLPVGSNAAGYNSSMQAPDNPGPGPGNANAADAQTSSERIELEDRIAKKQAEMSYWDDQVEATIDNFQDILAHQEIYRATGRSVEWQKLYDEGIIAIRQSKANLSIESNILNVLQNKLANGNYSITDSSLTKRTFIENSTANNDSSGPSTKRRPNQ